MQSNEPDRLESRSIKSKMKEVTAIALFTLAAALASVILADTVFFPLTRFAVKNVDIFNLIFRNLLLLVILVFLVYKIVSNYRRLSEDGMRLTAILFYFIKRPLHYSGLFLSFLLISIILVTLLYLLFSLNYYYLYKISGGV